MTSRIRIGIIGGFNPSYETHRATNDALKNTADFIGVSADVQWLGTERLETERLEDTLRQYQGLIGAPGSP